MPNWNNLKFVLETVRLGGVGSAARHMRVNETTVVRRLKAAESELGTKLFQHQKTGYVATEQGLRVAESARKIEQEFVELENYFSDVQKELRGTLTITAPPLLIDLKLSSIFADFHAQNKSIRLNVHASNRFEDLQDGGADIAIRVTRTPPESLFGVKVGGHYAAVYSNSADARRIERNECAPLDWIDLKPIKYAYQQNEHLGDVNTVVSADDPISARSSIRSGIGIGYLPCFVGDMDPELFRVPDCPLICFSDLWILTHRDHKDAPKVRNFIHFAQKALRSSMSSFAI